MFNKVLKLFSTRCTNNVLIQLIPSRLSAEATEKFFRAPLLLLALRVGLQLVVLVSTFVMISTVWLVS